MTTETERISFLEGQYEHLATKADVADVRTEIANVRMEVANVRTEVANFGTEIANVRTDVAHLKADLIKWVVGTVLAGMGVATGIGVALLKLLG